jgi:hypothetical protein
LPFKCNLQRYSSVPTFVECMPCDYLHGACMPDGTCKCIVSYTGLDCSLRCSPCVHGVGCTGLCTLNQVYP